MMIVRTYLLAGLFALIGVGVMTRPTAKPYHVDEAWLEQQYPTTMGRYTMIPDADDGSKLHSYKMDATTYQLLKPYGIVGRILTDGDHAFDVVTLAGDSPESFHNPLQCFAAQEWTIHWNKEITIPTKSRGDVHAMIAEASQGSAAPQYALYTYESPSGTCSTPPALGKELLWAEFKSGKVQFATFFRFMSRTPNVTEEQMIGFARDYLDASPVRPIERLKA